MLAGKEFVFSHTVRFVYTASRIFLVGACSWSTASRVFLVKASTTVSEITSCALCLAFPFTEVPD